MKPPLRFSLLLVLPLLAPVLMASGSRYLLTPDSPDTSLDRYLADLNGTDRSDRLFAARELKSRLKKALRDVKPSRQASLAYAESQAILGDFQQMVVPACVQALDLANVAPVCADILGLMESREAIPALRASLKSSPPPRLYRHINRALKRIAQGEAP